VTLALLLAAVSLPNAGTATAAAATATATIRVFRAVRLNDAAQLDRENARLRLVPVLTDGKVQHILVAEFQ
jgi:hypothetical protein